MSSRFIGIAVLIVVVIAAFMIFSETRDGPLENAAEDVEAAVDELD